MIILTTGFAPFGGETINPSYEAVRLLPDNYRRATRITKLELPVTFEGDSRPARRKGPRPEIPTFLSP